MRLRADNLSRHYRDADKALCVVEGLTYEFPQHGAIAIMGRSGVGKSTLLHLLGGLDRPSGGDVWWDDISLAAAAPDELARLRGAHVGFVFQFHHLLPEFTALENIAMPLAIAGVADAEAVRRAADVLARVGLSDRASHLPSQLSGGEQQRVAIARAIVSNPSVILADEPTGNLDLKTAREVQELLLSVHRELKNLLVIVTHSSELAAAMEERLEMLPGGSLVRA